MTRDWPEIFVLRHGQTEWNAAKRMQGRQDSPLTEAGLAHAAQQGRLLAAAGLGLGDVACFASPQPRAWRTAEIALARIGRAPVEDARLQEIAFGNWEGLTRDEIAVRDPWSTEIEDMLAWTFAAPGCETLAQMCDRCLSFLNDLDRPTVIVTHGITSRVLRGLYVGLDRDGMSGLPGGQGVVFRLKGA